MTNMKIAELRETSVATLQEFSEGDWVEYSDGNYGIVVSKVEGPIEWPTGDDETESVGKDGDTIYVVARETGGSKPFSADEIDEAERSDVFDDPDEVPDNPEKGLKEAEMAQVYYRVNEPHDYEELRFGLDELLSVPGIDDPGVGFDSMPPSWRKADEPARLILLDAYSSMGGTWTGAYQELGSKRLASAIKDEVYQTDEWRGKF